MKIRSVFPEAFLAMLAAGLLTASCSQFLGDYPSFNNGGNGGLPSSESGSLEEPEIPFYAENNVWINAEDGAHGVGYQNLNAALDWLKNNAVNNGDYTVLLGMDEILSPQTFNFGGLGKTVNITLVSADKNEKQIILAKPGILFQVGACVTLTLNQGISLIGLSNNDLGSLVYVHKNGALVMNNGSAVKGNAGKEYGAVAVEGTFVMNGGSITDNSKKFGFHGGGGVTLIDGIFTMSGGLIAGNSSSKGGGVGLCSDSGKNPVFKMNGGTISGNSGDWGGGVHISHYGKFEMTGGTVAGNSGIAGGGVCVEGAVWSSGEFIMTGGSISDNIAECNGGGIFSTQNVSRGKLVIGGNAVISGNSLKDNPFAGNGYGGGIYSAGFVVLQDNCVIEKNTAKGGAGVYLTLHQGSIIEQAFVMTGGVIRSNIAQEFGGGVALCLSSPYIQFHKTGGTIYGRDGNADANIVLNDPDYNEKSQPGNPKPNPGKNDQGENDNDQGDNNNQGENGGKNKKPNPPPVTDDNNVLSGNGRAAAVVKFDAANIFAIHLRKENTAGPNAALSSTAVESAGSWD